jgi:hypothetical protein
MDLLSPRRSSPSISAASHRIQPDRRRSRLARPGHFEEGTGADARVLPQKPGALPRSRSPGTCVRYARTFGRDLAAQVCRSSSAPPDRARMNPAEFDNIAGSERTFWWYRGMQEILFRLLDPLVKMRRTARCSRRAAAPDISPSCSKNDTAGRCSRRPGTGGLALRPGDARLTRRSATSRRCRSPAVRSMVVSMDVIVHFPRGEEGRPVAEFARVLRPGGVMAIRVSALDLLRSRHSMFAEERQRFTKTRLVRCWNNGLRVTRCTYANSLLLPVALAKFRIWEPLTRLNPAAASRRSLHGSTGCSMHRFRPKRR